MKLLITGGAGFIGSNFIRYWFKKFEKSKVINIDKLTYAGDNEPLNKLKIKYKYEFVKLDISNTNLIEEILSKYKPDFVIHFAA